MFFGDAIRAAVKTEVSRSHVVPFTPEFCGPDGKPFPEQWNLITCSSLAIALLCARRAGKTAGLVYRVAKRSWEEPGRRTLYIHHTLSNATSQFFKATSPGEVALLDVLDQHGIKYQARFSPDVCVKFENGSFVQVVGCDNIAQVRKKLGFGWDEVIVDEAQDHDHVLLETLIKKTILPTLIDSMGALVIAGTPPNVEAGLWFETLNNPRYTHIRWPQFANPVITREAVVESMGKAGYVIDFENPDNNDPLIQREIFGLIKFDPRDLLYPFDLERNSWPLTGIPALDSNTWLYSMGIDIGGANEGNDRDAVVVLGWRRDDGSKKIYVREEWEEHEFDSEEFCTRLVETYRRWRPMVSVCGDTGGAGANKALKRFSTRAGYIEFEPKPTSVDLSTRLLNDELRSGRMQVDRNGLVARDVKLCSKKGSYHSDIMASLRYAHHGARNWASKNPDPQPKPNSEDAVWARRMDQWRQEEREAKRTGWRSSSKPQTRHPLS